MNAIDITKIIESEFKPLLGAEFHESPPFETAVENATERICMLKPIISPTPIHQMDAEEFEKLIHTCAKTAEDAFTSCASDSNWLKAAYHLYEAYAAIKARSGN